MRLRRVMRLLVVGALCAVLVALGGASFAAGDLPDCTSDGLPPQGFFQCMDESGEVVMDGTSSSGPGPMDDGFGIPSGFIAAFVLMLLIGVAVTIWRVSTARQLARQSGMDPDIATGMTLVEDNGLSATYLASNLRTAMAPQAPLPPSATATDRLTELKKLLDNGLITQAEYETRRTAIIDSV